MYDTDTIRNNDCNGDVSNWRGYILHHNVSWSIIDNHYVWPSVSFPSVLDRSGANDIRCNRCIDGWSWFHDTLCRMLGNWFNTIQSLPSLEITSWRSNFMRSCKFSLTDSEINFTLLVQLLSHCSWFFVLKLSFNFFYAI